MQATRDQLAALSVRCVTAADELSQVQEYLVGFSPSVTVFDQVKRLDTAALRLMEASRLIEGVIETIISESATEKPVSDL